MTAIALPWPPAVNNLYLTASHGKRVRTKRYDAWLSEGILALRQQRVPALKGSFRITLVCERPDKRIRDLDGLCKAPLDLLVKAGVIEDDSLCEQLTVGWSPLPPAKPGRVVVTLEKAWPSIARKAA